MADDEEAVAMTAFFPLSFGKQSNNVQSHLSSVHSSTRRTLDPSPTNPNSSSAAKDDDDGVMVGPPRPPPANDDEDGEMIGPPRPPPRSSKVIEDDDDEDDELDDDESDDFRRVPLSNEIVLKGHTKAQLVLFGN